MNSGPNRTVFLAGASGVIGRRLGQLLVEEGWRVVGTTRSPEKALYLDSLGVQPLVLDVFDARGLKEAVLEVKPAVIVHMLTDLPPALNPAEMATARVRNAHVRDIGTRNLVAAALAAGTPKFVAQSVCFSYAPGQMPYREDWPLNAGSIAGAEGVTARGIVSLERQVMAAPFGSIVLRYGRLYGPDTGFDTPGSQPSVHVDAAADAARRAVGRSRTGAYNIADEGRIVSIQKARSELDWRPEFRLPR